MKTPSHGRKTHRVLTLIIPILLFTFLVFSEKKTESVKSSDVVSSRAQREIQVPESKVERGPNQRLEYSQPREVKREVEFGMSFSEVPFVWDAKNPLGPLSLNQHTFSAIDTSYDPGFAKRFLESEAERFIVPLSEDRVAEVKVERALSRGEGTHTFFGKVTGEELSEVLLVFHDGVVSGSVVFYKTNDHYEFGVSGDGDIAVRHLDPLSYTANCGCGNHDDRVAAGDELNFNGLSELPIISQSITSESSGTAGTIIDTVVGYGEQARIEDGGVAAIEARILASVDRTNLAFASSEVTDIEIVLLGTIEDPDYQFPGDIGGAMGAADELGDLNNSSNGNLDTVTDLKDELGADHVVFVLKDADGSAGVAFRPGTSMITARNYMSSLSLVFVHEMGHSIGCKHAWGDSSGDLSTSVTQTGWRFIGPNVGQRRTIMAYGTSFRMPYYSNPNVQVDGVNTGAVTGYDASGDGTADSRLVSGGYLGGAGAGFDGSNPDLGANNAAFIQQSAITLANQQNRRASLIQIEEPANTPLENIFGKVDFVAPALTDVITKTITIRNAASENLAELSVSAEGNANGAFSLGILGSTTLTPGSATTLTVSFTPQQVEVQTVELRFATTTAGVFDTVIQLQGIYDPPKATIQVEYPSGSPLEDGLANFALTATALSETIDRTFVIRNSGELDLINLSVAFDNNDNGTFTAGAFSSTTIAPGGSATVTASFAPQQAGLESVVMRILSNDPDTPEFRVNLAGSFDGPIYEESFEDGFGIWTNTGELDWRRRMGATPSSGTGPNADNPGDGDYYSYVEVTILSVDTTYSLEAVFDLNDYSSAELNFIYFMYGAQIGSLHVDVMVNGVWQNSIWSLAGQQQSSGADPWLPATVNLASYLGQGDVTLRFRGVRSSFSSSKGDMAIDGISLTADLFTHSLNYIADIGGSISGSASQEIAVGEDGSAVEAIADTDYTFLRWSDGSTQNPRTDISVSADLTVTAIFQPDTIERFNDWLIGTTIPLGSSSPLDAPLNDGLPNLMKYAFNLDPAISGADFIVPSTGVAGLPYLSLPAGADTALSVEFIRRRNSIDLVYRVQFSDDLNAASWTESGIEQSAVPIDDDWERVIVTDSVNQSSKSTRFSRVAVELILE